MGQSPISSHFFPLVATIGRENGESNVSRENFFNRDRHLRHKLDTEKPPLEIRKINNLQMSLKRQITTDVATQQIHSKSGLEPQDPARNDKKREPACKPGSVEDNHSSGTYVAARLKRPTRRPARAAPCPLRGLPPYLVLLQVGFAVP